jgi:hypothetical protein
MSTNRPRNSRDLIVPAVTTLPTGSDRYEGREVDYFPSGSNSSRCWRLVWRSALNSGNGAWSVVSSNDPLNAVQSASGTVNNSSAITNMPNGPEITVPITGVYIVTAFGSVANANALGLGDLYVRFARDTTNLIDMAAVSIGISAWQRQTIGQVADGRAQTLTAGWVARLRVSFSRADTDIRYGDYIRWNLSLQPLELRP